MTRLRLPANVTFQTYNPNKWYAVLIDGVKVGEVAKIDRADGYGKWRIVGDEVGKGFVPNYSVQYSTSVYAAAELLARHGATIVTEEQAVPVPTVQPTNAERFAAIVKLYYDWRDPEGARARWKAARDAFEAEIGVDAMQALSDDYETMQSGEAECAEARREGAPYDDRNL